MDEVINLTLPMAEGQGGVNQIFPSRAVEATSQKSNTSKNINNNNYSNGNNNNSNSSCLRSTMARTILGILHRSPYVFLTSILGEWGLYYPHFTEKEAEV